MKTLYNLLGISSQATPIQIEQAYKHSLDAFAVEEGNGQVAEEKIRLQALREAYLVLSSPTRRQAYDQQLKERRQLRYEVFDHGVASWGRVLLLVAIMTVAGGYYLTAQQDKALLELEVAKAKAKAEAERAEWVAAAEQAQLEREKLARDQRAEEIRRREMEQARGAGQRINDQNQQVMVRTNYEKQ